MIRLPGQVSSGYTWQQRHFRQSIVVHRSHLHLKLSLLVYPIGNQSEINYDQILKKQSHTSTTASRINVFKLNTVRSASAQTVLLDIWKLNRFRDLKYVIVNWNGIVRN